MMLFYMVGFGHLQLFFTTCETKSFTGIEVLLLYTRNNLWKLASEHLVMDSVGNHICWR